MRFLLAQRASLGALVLLPLLTTAKPRPSDYKAEADKIIHALTQGALTGECDALALPGTLQ
jgi:hypothetical protein